MASIYYVGDWALLLGPSFVESPFSYQQKGVEIFNYGHWLIGQRHFGHKGFLQSRLDETTRSFLRVGTTHFTLRDGQYFLVGNPLPTFTTMSVSAGSLTKAIAQDALPAAACVCSLLTVGAW